MENQASLFQTGFVTLAENLNPFGTGFMKFEGKTKTIFCRTLVSILYDLRSYNRKNARKLIHWVENGFSWTATRDIFPEFREKV